MTRDTESKARVGQGASSHPWEVAKEVRARGEECGAALEAAIAASQILDEHLQHVSRVAAPATAGEATSITAGWYEIYQTLSSARERAFTAFEQCAERVIRDQA